MMNIVEYIEGPFIKARQTSLIDRQASTHKFVMKSGQKERWRDEKISIQIMSQSEMR